MFNNVYFVPFVWAILAILAIWFVRIVTVKTAMNILKNAEASKEALEIFKSQKKYVDITAVLLTVIVLGVFGFSMMRKLIINETPQSSIDRSNVFKHQQKLSKELRKEAEE